MKTNNETLSNQQFFSKFMSLSPFLCILLIFTIVYFYFFQDIFYFNIIFHYYFIVILSFCNDLINLFLLLPGIFFISSIVLNLPLFVYSASLSPSSLMSRIIFSLLLYLYLLLNSFRCCIYSLLYDSHSWFSFVLFLSNFSLYLEYR